jgi:hypothetical protein
MLDFIMLLSCPFLAYAAFASWKSFVHDLEQYEIRMNRAADNYGIRRQPEPKESDDGSL